MAMGDLTEQGDEDLQEILYYVQSRVAEANEDIADAVTQAAPLVDPNHPSMTLQSVHGKLLPAYASLVAAIDRTENTLDRIDEDYGSPTPRQIKSEHGDRLAESYDGPVLCLALQLLEWNRRKWLHKRTDTQGEAEVRRHGLTGNQRKWLNELDEAWREYDGD